ncbi:MAG: hypothetical protein CMF82_03195 [Candidatus Marinimicrobia bacterium]|nr:hypothetical protein [Candidatus Neomarinimicrobiota bacterium]|tara:strand:+ start:345 stop:932 length:588 start_codon:yes stop_codon:yes gene_type:complete
MKTNITKEKIEQSTLNLIDKQPFQEISTKQIANESGVAEITLFRHYKNKNNLLNILVEKFFHLIIDFDSKKITTEEDFRIKLNSFFKKSISSNPLQRKLFKVFLYIGMYKKKKFLKYASIYEMQIAGPIEDVVEKGKQQWGYRKEVRTDIVVKLLINSIGFFNIIQNVFLLKEVKPYDLDEVVEIAVDNFLKALK